MNDFRCSQFYHAATTALVLLLLMGFSFDASYAMRRQLLQRQTAAAVQLQESILRQMENNVVDSIQSSSAKRNPAFILRPKQDTNARRASTCSPSRTPRIFTKAQQRVFDACSQNMST